MEWYFILGIVIIILIFLVIIVKSKNNKKAQNKSTVPMEAPSENMLNLIENAKKEAAEEKAAYIKENTPIQTADINIEDLNDLFDEDFTDLTYSSSENIIENPVKKKITAEEFVKIENKNDKLIENDKIPDEIKSYISNNFRLSGESLSDGTVNKFSVCIIEKDTRMSTNIDNKNVDILISDNKMYIINGSNNTYIEINDSFLRLIGKKKEDIIPKQIGVSKNFSSIIPKVFYAMVDNEETICFEFSNDKKIMRFYTLNGKIKTIVSGADADNIDMFIKVSDFVSFPNKTYISLNGLNKEKTLLFFKDLLK